MPRPVTSWIYLGNLWDACWGLQGVSSLAGEVSALGLKQAEVAGAVGPSLPSANQAGQASVLHPCPGLATCSFSWTAPWRSPTPPVLPPFVRHCGLCWAEPCASTELPAPGVSSTAQSRGFALLWLAWLVPFSRGSLGKEEVVGATWPDQLDGGCKNGSRFTLMCKWNLLYGNRWKTLTLEASHSILPVTVAEDSYKLNP